MRITRPFERFLTLAVAMVLSACANITYDRDDAIPIPAGATASYSEIAQACGCTRAVRAVGAAIGRNPVGIVVPCHRVLGAGGQLTGYAGGLPRKSALLALEGVRINGSPR